MELNAFMRVESDRFIIPWLEGANARPAREEEQITYAKHVKDRLFLKMDIVLFAHKTRN